MDFRPDKSNEMTLPLYVSNLRLRLVMSVELWQLSGDEHSKKLPNYPYQSTQLGFERNAIS